MYIVEYDVYFCCVRVFDVYITLFCGCVMLYVFFY